MPLLVTFTHVSVVAATSFRWKGMRSGYDGQSEPADGCPGETWQGFAKTSLSLGSGKGSSARC